MTTPNSLALTLDPPDAPASPPPAVTLTAEQQLTSQYDIADPPAVYAKPAAAVTPKAPPETPPEVVTPATQPAAPPVPPLINPANPQRHPKYLLQQAADFGMPVSVVNAVSSDVLGDLVYRETKRVMAERQSQGQAALRQGDVPPPELVAAAATPAGGVPAAPAKPKIEWGDVEEEVDGVAMKRKILDEDIHPALRGVLEKAFGRIDQLEVFIAGGVQQQQAQAERQQESRIDAWFATNERVFGKGGAAEVKGTAFFARRKAVWMAAKEMPAEVKAGMTVEQALAAAAKDVLGIAPAAAAAAAAPPKQTVVDEWNLGVLNKPTSRQPAQIPAGREKAVQTVEQFLADAAADEDAAGRGDATLNEFL